MDINYKVHSISQTKFNTQVEFQGSVVSAAVDCLEVELIAANNSQHGTVTLRFIGPDFVTAKEIFYDDAVVTLSLSVPHQHGDGEEE